MSTTFHRPVPGRRLGSGRVRLWTLAFGLVLLAAAPGCSNDGDEVVLDRERFISTYVDLRVAALRTDEGELTDSARQAVLRAHGVTSDDLLAFVEAHGEQMVFMRDVWNEVEARLDSVPPLEPDQP